MSLETDILPILRSHDQEMTETRLARDAALGRVEALEGSLADLEQEVVDLEKALAECQASHEPGLTAPLIGMSAPSRLWAERKDQVEATGGRLQARRLFFGSLTASLSPIQAAIDEGLLPVTSFKVGTSWLAVARGDYDSQLRSLADRLEAFGEKIVVILHHEPDQQSDGRLQGEGGTAADFAAMYRRATPLLKAAPNVEVWVCMNGWVFGDLKSALTDAELDIWLPPDIRKMLDGVASDDYSPEGGNQPAVDKTRNRVEWAKRVGDVRSLGIGETNAYSEAELRDVFALVKEEPLFRGGWALVWNSTGEDYKPLTETGLLPVFQDILADWE